MGKVPDCPWNTVWDTELQQIELKMYEEQQILIIHTVLKNTALKV